MAHGTIPLLQHLPWRSPVGLLTYLRGVGHGRRQLRHLLVQGHSLEKDGSVAGGFYKRLHDGKWDYYLTRLMIDNNW